MVDGPEPKSKDDRPPERREKAPLPPALASGELTAQPPAEPEGRAPDSDTACAEPPTAISRCDVERGVPLPEGGPLPAPRVASMCSGGSGGGGGRPASAGGRGTCDELKEAWPEPVPPSRPGAAADMTPPEGPENEPLADPGPARPDPRAGEFTPPAGKGGGKSWEPDRRDSGGPPGAAPLGPLGGVLRVGVATGEGAASDVGVVTELSAEVEAGGTTTVLELGRDTRPPVKGHCGPAARAAAELLTDWSLSLMPPVPEPCCWLACAAAAAPWSAVPGADPAGGLAPLSALRLTALPAEPPSAAAPPAAPPAGAAVPLPTLVAEAVEYVLCSARCSRCARMRSSFTQRSSSSASRADEGVNTTVCTRSICNCVVGVLVVGATAAGHG